MFSTLKFLSYFLNIYCPVLNVIMDFISNFVYLQYKYYIIHLLMCHCHVVFYMSCCVSCNDVFHLSCCLLYVMLNFISIILFHISCLVCLTSCCVSYVMSCHLSYILSLVLCHCTCHICNIMHVLCQVQFVLYMNYYPAYCLRSNCFLRGNMARGHLTLCTYRHIAYSPSSLHSPHWGSPG